MHDARGLIEAVGWLHYQDLCGKSHLFSESHLRYSVGEWLSAKYRDQVCAERIHPILDAHEPGRKGRRGGKRRLDFAVVGSGKKYTLAMEVKWCSGSPNLRRDILRDLAPSVIRQESSTRTKKPRLRTALAEFLPGSVKTCRASLRSSEGQIDFGAANLLPKRSPDIFHPLARHLVGPKICGALDGNSQITNGQCSRTSATR
jgi:hypothetical protein